MDVLKQKIVIVDYGMGNLHSVSKKLNRIGVNSLVSGLRNEIKLADKIILPGVGHFAKAMENLKNMELIETLNEFALIDKKPVLGICLGMQLMAMRSEEGNSAGLGWFDAGVVKFKINDNLKYKVPHTGWNTLLRSKKSMLLTDISENAEFYFVHAYHFENKTKEDILTETDYEYRFCSAVEKTNIFGVQFHPEKSHDAGEIMFRNFVAL